MNTSGNCILSRRSPPMRLHEWVLHHNAFKFWRCLCKKPANGVLVDPREICPDVNLEDIPLKDMQSARLNKYIESYQSTVSKEKRVVTIETADSSMDLIVHNIVMVMELKQKIQKQQQHDLNQVKPNNSGLYEPSVEPNKVTWQEMDEIFGNIDMVDKIFNKPMEDGQHYTETLINNWLSTFINDQDANENNMEINGDTKSGWVSAVRQILQQQNSKLHEENPLTAFIETEEKKFFSYLLYMTKSVKDPGFTETSRRYKLFNTHKNTVNTSTDNEDFMDVDNEDQSEELIDDVLSKAFNEIESQNMDTITDTEMLDSDLHANSNFTTQYDVAYVKRDEYMKLPQFRVNLQNIACATIKLGSQFNQRKFASVCCRSHFFQLTVNIYPHGTISSTGSTHEIASILAFQYIVSILRDIYGPTAFEDPYIKLNNLVLSGYTGYPICINLLTTKFPAYFRKIKGFSGITFINRARTDKITLLIFKGGSICVSGGGSIESVIENTKLALSMIKQCKENPENLIQENKLMELAKNQQVTVTAEKSKRTRRNKVKKET